MLSVECDVWYKIVVGIVGEQSQPEGTVCVHVRCTFDQAKSMGRVTSLHL